MRSAVIPVFADVPVRMSPYFGTGLRIGSAQDNAAACELRGDGARAGTTGATTVLQRRGMLHG